jgi:RNA polymerase sigma factor (sigma-70 family)
MTSTPVTDEALWSRSVAGDGEAFGSLFDRHRDRVFGHACRLLEHRHDAEDVAASAFLELWRRRDAVRLVNGSVLPWLLVTTANLSRNSRRGTRRYRDLLDRLPRAGSTPDAADQAFATQPLHDLDPRVAAELRRLKPQDLRLISLVVFDDVPLADAAALLSLSEAAAKSRLQRARRRLRDALTDQAPATQPATPAGAES